MCVCVCGSKSYGNEMERLGLWRTEASRSSNSYICRSSLLHSLLVFTPSPQRSAALHTRLNKAGLWESVWMPARSHAAVKQQAFHPSHFWTNFFLFAPTFSLLLFFLPNPSLAFPPHSTFLHLGPSVPPVTAPKLPPCKADGQFREERGRNPAQ